MRIIPAAAVLLSSAVLVSCDRDHHLKNETRPAGYAMGERIALRFSLSGNEQHPDSINVRILEKKTGYEYSQWAHKDSCDTGCRYTCIWDGRKPDGRWPAGGRYIVYAVADLEESTFSDTIMIGLGD